MSPVYPVILCGGSGTRLWPLSRDAIPKQFATRLGGAVSLFQACAQRLSSREGGVTFAAPTILTRSDFRFIVLEQLRDIGINPGDILLEPTARNTAPAMLAAALYLMNRAPDAVMLVAPSDHVIPDTDLFHAAVAVGLDAVAAGKLVTFGVRPNRPETGYGYLELTDARDGSGRAQPLRRFVEKPDLATARAMLAEGGYLWNTGIFLFTARDLIAAVTAHVPELMPPVSAALAGARPDLGFLRLDARPWAELPAVSIDYAVMEKSNRLIIVPFAGHWSDLGSWSAVHAHRAPDADGVAQSGSVTAIGCRNSLLWSETPALELVALGLDNMIAVAMPDAVLVARMDQDQVVRQAVAQLRTQGAIQADQSPVAYRPWGHAEYLTIGPGFQVRRVSVRPGGVISLQSHAHRAEHWIVVSGQVQVALDGHHSHLVANQSIYLPRGSRHRLENQQAEPAILIEVQTGSYLSDDDVTRYE
ncbi:MAG: mannose-1-phosphate guanylyltransferase/mannose-6-phosphate isomerase [Rhodobacteraceae bacterium]|nr:mannose-1-phosphate guanylyltransferase/mannose-6-phosphate isomerase [Paracoccaceae bacterium]